ncbi:MAG: TonB-dependent receptor [Acidobacteria bacterium]|nr:MAG: TonB-dependent receptor [Acidobacteriota bacterium]
MPTRRRPSEIGLGLGLALALAAFLGAEDQRDLTAISLEELAQTKVTTVSKTEEPRFRTPAAVYVVTAEDIRRSGATSIPEALRLAPGVHVARINANQWAVGIRGFTSRLARSQLAIMDGRTLYNPLFAGTYCIEIVRGPGGTLWGANAVNGIVNIVTKDAKDTQGWFLSAGGGNEERAFLRARYGGTIAGKGSYRVYGKYFRRDAAFHATTDAYDAWHMAQGGFRTDWKLPGDDRLTVQGDAYSGRAGERTTLSFYERPFLRTAERQAPLSGGNVTARWAHVMNGSALTVNAYYDRTNRAEPSFQEARDTFELDLQHQFGLGQSQRVVWGLGYRLSDGRGQGIETVAFIPPDRTDHIFSAFVHDDVDLVNDRLRLSVGTKLERNRYTGFELQPSARLIWAPGPRHAVWTAASRAVRTPSRLERDLLLTAALSPTAPLFARVIGNEGFTSEKTWAYEAGYRIQPADRLSLEAAAFHDRYRDLTSLEQDRPFVESGRQILPFRFANMLRGRSSGVEVTSLAHLSTRWWISAEYSYLSLHLETRPGSTDTSSVASVGSSPRHMARAQSSWNLPGHVDLDVGFRWVDRLHSQKVPAYSELDARAGWQVVSRLELAVVGQNLLHKHHPEFGGSPEPTKIERSVYGEARWRW